MLFRSVSQSRYTRVVKYSPVVKDDEAEIILRKYLKIKGNLKRAKQGTICAIMKEHPYTRECIQSICSGHSFPDIYERVIKEFSFE